MRGEGSESVGLFLSDLCQPKIGETVIFERKQKIHQHCGFGLGGNSVLFFEKSAKLVFFLQRYAWPFFCGGVSQTIVGNWSCTSIEFRIVLVVGRFVFHCIRLWKRFSLSVQDLFYKKCAVLFRVFLCFLYCCSVVSNILRICVMPCATFVQAGNCRQPWRPQKNKEFQ